MNQRIRPSLPINRRTTGAVKSDTLVKRQRARILLIHIGGQGRNSRDGALYERLANAFSMLVRMNEKRLKMAVMQKHETLRPVGIIYRKIKLHLRKKGHQFGFDGRLVRCRKEIVRGVDGLTPDLHDLRQVLIGRGSKSVHAAF